MGQAHYKSTARHQVLSVEEAVGRRYVCRRSKRCWGPYYEFSTAGLADKKGGYVYARPVTPAAFIQQVLRLL